MEDSFQRTMRFSLCAKREHLARLDSLELEVRSCRNHIGCSLPMIPMNDLDLDWHSMTAAHLSLVGELQ